MANSEQPRRRFVPIPIETTFQSVRKEAQHQNVRFGPDPELTPEASPRTPPPHMPLNFQSSRRFAPQLIETSRRTFRLGDSGPATRPTDKTDITPYTNHIYTSKPKPRRKKDGTIVQDDFQPPQPPTRRETEEEGVLEYLLELAAKEAERQMEEDALAAFPNSRAREGGVDHFYFDEGSGSDESLQITPAEGDKGTRQRVRRKSSNLGMNWWHTHMQKHAEELSRQLDGDEDEVEDKAEKPKTDKPAEEKGAEVSSAKRDQSLLMRSDSDLDRMELPAPPDPMWTTTNTRVASEDRRDSLAEQAEALALSSRLARDEPAAIHVLPPAHQLQQHQNQQPPSQTPDQLSTLNPSQKSAAAAASPFGRPFATLGLKPDEAQLRRLRKLRSPPMLGKELNFRQCPSPKTTKLETDHPFVRHLNDEHEHHRDMSGNGGLWRGYCCRSESTGGYIVPADLQPQKMIATPFPPATPREPAAYDFDSQSVSEEPSSILSTSAASSDSLGSFISNGQRGSYAEARGRGALWTGAVGLGVSGGEPKGLHMLHGLDERLLVEKARAERDDKIANEFGDAFVTQVYNYLSLGYPAMARSFDPELSKISRVPIEELSRNDTNEIAKGHMLEMQLDEASEEPRCPRWTALRIYITEWARQHPDLDNLDPLAWGVRERRGSWAI